MGYKPRFEFVAKGRICMTAMHLAAILEMALPVRPKR